jgi:hypothetical protein
MNYEITNQELFESNIESLEVSKDWKHITIYFYNGSTAQLDGEHSSIEFQEDYGFILS